MQVCIGCVPIITVVHVLVDEIGLLVFLYICIDYKKKQLNKLIRAVITLSLCTIQGIGFVVEQVSRAKCILLVITCR